VTSLSDIPALAADRIIEQGWAHGDWTGTDGEECLHQAVRMCALQAGDGYVVSAWLTANGYPTAWNDTKGRTRDDVLFMLKGLDLTDATLEDTFGSNWRAFVALMRLLRNMTTEQARTLAAAWDAAGAAAGGAAWGAAWDAAGAATTKDLIGMAGYTQEHYDLLTGPIVAVFGEDWDRRTL